VKALMIALTVRLSDDNHQRLKALALLYQATAPPDHASGG